VSIASITAGTLDKIAVVGTVSTILALPVLSASNVSIASITAGTLDKLALCDTVSTVGTILTLPVISGTGLLLGATTAKVGAFVATAHGSAWNGYAVSTTSGAATILKTSGGHTLYVTDLLFSVDVPMNIDIRSATTVKATVYLATKGGFVFPTATPMILNSAESLTFQPSASGSCAGYAAGYTVT
jgi:hypothetical protein